MSPDRVFARLLLGAVAALGLLGTTTVLLLTLKASPVGVGVRSLRCLLAPMSSLDVVVHTSALVTALLGGLALLAALRTARREGAVAVELRRATRTARLCPLPRRVAAVARNAGVAERLDVIEAFGAFAFVYGWAQPRICVSLGLVDRLTSRELEAVLHHEEWHRARRDPARRFVVGTIAAAFPFAPPVRRLAQQYVLATELAADRYAVVAMGHHRWLAGALAKTLDAPVAAPAFAGCAEARIAVLAGEPPPPASGSGRAIAGLLACELILMATVLSRGGLPLLANLWLHPAC